MVLKNVTVLENNKVNNKRSLAMRRVLAAAVLVAFVPTANAQDKGKADFSANAEYRARYFNMENPTANEKALSRSAMAEGRFKFNGGFKANEKMSATLTLLHNTNFGVDDNNQAAGSSGTGTSSTAHPTAANTTVNDGENFLGVNQAYVTWTAADDLMFQVGRMNLQLGDGTLVGLNDWQKNPTAWEGVLAGWEQEFGKFWFAGLKLRNIQVDAAAAGDVNTASNGDPEHNAYIVGFDLKTMPEWMKTAHFHIVKNNGDALDANAAVDGFAATTKDGLDTMRYGTNLGFAFGAFDAKAWYEAQSGKVININDEVKTEYDYEGNMMAAQVGFSVPNFMSSRFHLHYHVSSGDKDGTDKKLEGYDPYATEQHGSAGMMDLFGWGNLTMINVGWTLKTDDKTDIGVMYSMFSRTEAGSTATPAQTYNQGLYGQGLPNAANDKDKLGDEIDVWATHSYGGGLSTTLRLGMFSPGDYFSDASNDAGVAGSGIKQDSKIMHIMIEGKATF